MPAIGYNISIFNNTYMRSCFTEKECFFNSVETLSNWLDMLVAINIEEKMSCTFDCCVGNDLLPHIRSMIEAEEKKHFLKNEGLKLLRELEKYIDKYVIYCDAKDFSKTKTWLDFVEFACKANIFFKDIMKRSTA